MTEKKRLANIELLRCAAMMMVIVLHYLGKGGLLTPLDTSEFDAVSYTAWILEALSIAAVNVYMLISGYFLCESSFKVSRLINIWLQIWFYSVTFGLIGALTGVVRETAVDTYYYLRLLFPVSMEHYWFLSAYVFLYLLFPFLGIAIRKMTKEQLQIAILGLFLFFCILKSVLPVRLDLDRKGYDCLWYVCVFAAAGYIRRFGIPALDKKSRGVLLYFGSVLMILAETLVLRTVYLKTGSLGLILGVAFEYNHLFAFTAALGLFFAFKNLQVGEVFGKYVTAVSPLTLGVYLLHENLGFRYSWQSWFGADRVRSAGMLLLTAACAVIVVFILGILVEKVRAVLFFAAHRVLLAVQPYKKIAEKIRKADETFAAALKE